MCTFTNEHSKNVIYVEYKSKSYIEHINKGVNILNKHISTNIMDKTLGLCYESNFLLKYSEKSNLMSTHLKNK